MATMSNWMRGLGLMMMLSTGALADQAQPKPGLGSSKNSGKTVR
jgi:hypothetical protein